MTFDYWKHAVKQKPKKNQWIKLPAELQHYDKCATNAGKSPLYVYFSCPFLEIETPARILVYQSSHIPDALCLHSPSSGPPHSSLNNKKLYSSSVYFSLLILVRWLNPSNIRCGQKKHSPGLPATLSTAWSLHPASIRPESVGMEKQTIVSIIFQLQAEYWVVRKLLW